MIKDKKTVIDGLKRLSEGQCKAPLENHPSWDINYDPLSLIWDAIDYVDNIDRVILNIVRDVLTSGGSIDTEADQDYICSVIEKRVEEEHKVKILITKTSDSGYEKVKEYENLESCVEELLSRDELYDNNTPEVVVYKKRPWLEYEQDVDYIVEIYDTWRE